MFQNKNDINFCTVSHFPKHRFFYGTNLPIQLQFCIKQCMTQQWEIQCMMWPRPRTCKRWVTESVWGQTRTFCWCRKDCALPAVGWGVEWAGVGLTGKRWNRSGLGRFSSSSSHLILTPLPMPDPPAWVSMDMPAIKLMQICIDPWWLLGLTLGKGSKCSLILRRLQHVKFSLQDPAKTMLVLPHCHAKVRIVTLYCATVKLNYKTSWLCTINSKYVS